SHWGQPAWEQLSSPTGPPRLSYTPPMLPHLFNTRLIVLSPKEGSTRGTSAKGNKNHQYRAVKHNHHDSYNPPAKRQTGENPGRCMKANFSPATSSTPITERGPTGDSLAPSAAGGVLSTATRLRPSISKVRSRERSEESIDSRS
ncbi:hypothetical protein HID58_087148, partial [Brassica napus]